MRRILFVVGLAVGYVIGARAGRPAFEAVVDRVKGIAGDERVQQFGEKAEETFEAKAPKVAAVAEQAASTVAGAASAAKDAGATEAEAAAPEPADPAGSAA